MTGALMNRVTGVGDILFAAKEHEGNKVEFWQPTDGE